MKSALAAGFCVLVGFAIGWVFAYGRATAGAYFEKIEYAEKLKVE